MKKQIFITAILLFSFIFLCSCGDAAKKENGEGLQIVTTVFPQYDFVRNITEGTGAEITMLLKTGSEPHSFEPTPSDMVTLSECDLFIWIGGESEAWAKKMIDSLPLDSEKTLALTSMVELIEVSEAGHSHGHYDEHVWTSPKNAVIMTRAICDKLVRIDPENKDVYEKNTDKYIEELTALDSDFEALSKKLDGKSVIVGDRFPFVYLTEAYGISYASPFKSCSSHAEASASEIAAVIEKAKAEGATTVFSVDFSNGKLAESISDEIGADVKVLRSCHTVTADELSSDKGYIDLMRENLKNLEELTKN